MQWGTWLLWKVLSKWLEPCLAFSLWGDWQECLLWIFFCVFSSCCPSVCVSTLPTPCKNLLLGAFSIPWAKTVVWERLWPLLGGFDCQMCCGRLWVERSTCPCFLPFLSAQECSSRILVATLPTAERAVLPFFIPLMSVWEMAGWHQVAMLASTGISCLSSTGDWCSIVGMQHCDWYMCE